MREAHIIRRRATLRHAGANAEMRNLEDWGDEDAYVLLGEPGAGKTCAMKAEADRVGGWYVSARDFATLAPKSAKIVFIDGIDEMRAGSRNYDGPLDAIRAKLDAMGRPRFRLSCREADWIAADQDLLAAVSPTGKVSVLQLSPLDDGERVELLRGKVPDLSGASKDLEPLLGNPLLLQLMADVVAKGGMPRSRGQLYEMACRSLVVEPNEVLRRAKPMIGASVDTLLHDAGMLCALLLIADRVGFATTSPVAIGAVLALEDIPQELDVQSATAALATRLFVEAGNCRVPRHRTIAEFLAARSVAHRVSDRGLPMSRVLALTCGFDGRPTEPLRGFHAWLSVHCVKERSTLIDRDPLGVVLYGDVRNFDETSKISVFQGLRAEAERFTWFRNGDWQTHPFGALGTPELTGYLTKLLRRPDRDPAHQATLECALDAIETGEKLPEVIPDLKRIICDESYWERIRLGALDAWLSQDRQFAPFGLQLLEDIAQGKVADRDDEIAGHLLSRLYPEYLKPSDALRFFHVRKNKNLIGFYQMFWNMEFVQGIASSDLTSAADDILPRLARFRHEEEIGYELRNVIGKLIVRVVTECGDSATSQQLHDWLSAGLDRYGSGRLEESESSSIARWLTEHPDAQKAVIAYGMRTLEKDENGRLRAWRITERLFRARRPRDWYRWMLDQATEAQDADIAQYCFESAAFAVRHQPGGFDITLDDVGIWVSQNSGRWPKAEQWMSEALSCKLDDYEGEQHRESLNRKAQVTQQDETRRAQFAPYIARIRDGSAPAGVLHQVAFAHQKRFYDIKGDTPEERVAHLLGVDIDVARRCIDGLQYCLAREDIPSVEEIIALDLEGRYHLLRPACLLALHARSQRGEDLAVGLPRARFDQLLAFALTDGSEEAKSWLDQVMKKHAAMAAPVFIQYARAKLVKNPGSHITGVWELRNEATENEGLSEFARLVLPSLLDAVPLRATEQHLNLLNRNLLPAALKHLPPATLEAILDSRLARATASAAQRLAWLAAGLTLNPTRYLPAVVDAVGANQRRAAMLGTALAEQSTRTRNVAKLPVKPVATLIDLLGPQTTPDRGPAGRVRDIDTRSDLVRGMVSQLASSSSREAGAALEYLRGRPLLANWKTHLDGALHDHRRVARAATFVHPSAAQIGNTLGNKQPANARDLVSLIADVIADLQEVLRHGDINGLVQFWRPAEDGNLVPRSENECRDVLLQMLRQQLLKRQVQLEKEAHAAHDTRADLRASAIVGGERVVVPIEIKKDNNRDVFSAWRDQLSDQYAQDPYADHTGMYMVLWFGKGPRISTKGKRIADADAMLNALKEAAAGEQGIHFAVLNLARPSA